MKNAIKRVVDGRHVALYPASVPHAPFVYLGSFMEVGGEILRDCEKLGTPPFALISISHLHWDEDLSPWPEDPVVTKEDHFTGQAPEFCRLLTEEIMPLVCEELGQPGANILGGYSMSGLFALYAPYLTDAFSKLISASGSVWYPGFVDYVKTHSFIRKPQAIYLSLGDKEARTKNEYLQRTQSAMAELEAHYQELRIPSTFELNEGGHHTQPVLRIAKGIHWVLTH